jgi:Pentapeptide repeats (9 copies)
VSVQPRNDVESYLRSADYNLINSESGFIVADKPGVGGDRDTLLVWLPAQIYPLSPRRPFSQFEPSLVDKIEAAVAQYPDARYTILVDSREGISRTFSEIVSGHGVKIRVPVEFFDAPFRYEESRDAASALKELRDPSLLTKRVAQPYSQTGLGSTSHDGPDLLEVLREDISLLEGPCIRFTVGNAGAGKSVLFESLFAILYRDFVDDKGRRIQSRRPIPFVPQHLRSTYTIRTLALVDSFLRSEVAAPVSRDTLEWMLVNGHCFWMFDGLDELYSGDPEFFDYLLDLLTRPGSRAQILVCARDSLMSSNDAFVQFIKGFSPSSDPSVKIYTLKDWHRDSKRYFAWLELAGRAPGNNEADPPPVAKFVAAVEATENIRTLSGVPYYCALLMERYKEGDSLKIRDEFTLLSDVISSLQEREVGKGLILLDAFEKNGLDDLLETIAADFCINNYAGTLTDDIRVYSEMVLRQDVTDEKRQKLITSLVQFPLFVSAERPGIVSFKHELLAEYLYGRQLAKSVSSDPVRAVSKLMNRPKFSDTLAFRYLVERTHENVQARAAILDKLVNDPPPDKQWRILLQLWLSSTPTPVRPPPGDFFEGRDLSGIKFANVHLSERSFRGANLTDVIFTECVLAQAKFEGARLVGTRFDRLDADALRAAQFGNIDNFEYIYSGSRLIEDRETMRRWMQERTGIIEPGADPCSTTLQLRELFGKYMHEDGSARRDELPYNALIRGRVHAGAPTSADCVAECIRHTFLNPPDYRNRVRRPSGDRYNELVRFMRDWNLSADLTTMLDKLCPVKGCGHIP